MVITNGFVGTIRTINHKLLLYTNIDLFNII
nr:MAG TPA: hypothetical protein [Caudoviricetes sp.]